MLSPANDIGRAHGPAWRATANVELSPKLLLGFLLYW